MDNTEKIKACTLWDDNNIHGFFGEYRFLSNFHIVNIQYEGALYPATENAYMAAKTLDLKQRVQFQNILPKDAKKLGREIVLRSDWEEVKEGIMYEVNLFKYSHYPELKEKLLATGNKHLEETNWWSDVWWGVCNGKGENNLGKILMKIRSELRNKIG